MLLAILIFIKHLIDKIWAVLSLGPWFAWAFWWLIVIIVLVATVLTCVAIILLILLITIRIIEKLLFLSLSDVWSILHSSSRWRILSPHLLICYSLLYLFKFVDRFSVSVLSIVRFLWPVWLLVQWGLLFYFWNRLLILLVCHAANTTSSTSASLQKWFLCHLSCVSPWLFWTKRSCRRSLLWFLSFGLLMWSLNSLSLWLRLRPWRCLTLNSLTLRHLFWFYSLFIWLNWFLVFLFRLECIRIILILLRWCFGRYVSLRFPLKKLFFGYLSTLYWLSLLNSTIL